MTKYEDLPRNGAGEIVAEEVGFPVEIGLKRPVELDGRTLESITVREPYAADIELCFRSESEGTRMVLLLATLADLEPAEVRLLTAVDFMRASRLVGSFL